MTGPRHDPEPDGLIVGLIRAPHGVRGEVNVDPRTDVPDRFRPGVTLQCDGIGPLKVSAVRGLAGRPVVRFDGYATRPQAEVLQGRFLRVSRDEARAAAGGAYLWADLLGLRAHAPDGTLIGELREVLRAGETDVLVIGRTEGGDLLVPALASVVREIDLDARRVVIVPQEEL